MDDVCPQSMKQDSQPVSLGRTGILAIFAGLVFAASLVLLSYFVEGLQLATRSATDLVMPVGLVWLGLFTARFGSACEESGRPPCCLQSGSCCCRSRPTPYVASTFIQSVEWSEQEPTATIDHPYRTVVVLGGGTKLTSKHTAELYRDGERVFSAAQLWHAGLASSIICTGSSSDGVGHPREIGANLLESVGVPKQVIFKVAGENTTQEMAGLQEFFDNTPPSFPEMGDIALITSGFHMRRAMRLAATRNLDFDPLPCGYRNEYFPRFSPRALIPNAEAADSFGLALKERLGGSGRALNVLPGFGFRTFQNRVTHLLGLLRFAEGRAAGRARFDTLPESRRLDGRRCVRSRSAAPAPTNCPCRADRRR